MGRAVNPATLMRSPGYSQGYLVGGTTLYVSGQLGTDEHGQYPGGDDVAAQFDQALSNLVAVVREAGGVPDDVVKMTFFVTDLDEWYGAMDRLGPIYRTHFGKHFPAITLLQQARMTIPGGKVEVEGIAVFGSARD
ncbi:MAG: RidA family protein [Acidimicrobiales bacterium]|nr:RidA family protein [Acidimicrobiales bacterium]